MVAVGPAARYQAAHLSQSLPFPLLLDPELTLQRVLGLRRQSRWAFVLNIRGWLRYVRAFVRNRRQGRLTGRPETLPAVVIVTPDRRVQWLHQGLSIADYPRTSLVIERLREQPWAPTRCIRVTVNPIKAAWQVWRAIRTTRPPRPTGTNTTHHDGFRGVLEAVAEGGVAAIADVGGQLKTYIGALAEVAPDELAPDEALAYWLNLYNAHALAAADEAYRNSEASVLRLPDVFSGPVATISGERLSLNAIEHGKVRRFGDPRIHAALVCGSVSCPTLRFEPFDGSTLDEQLDDQMRRFVINGGARIDGELLVLSRVFMWYSGDFTRKMPAWIPARNRDLVAALRPWLPPEAAGTNRLEFMDYDWALGCRVR